MPFFLKVCPPSKWNTLFLLLLHWPKCSYITPIHQLFDSPDPLPTLLHLLSAMGGWPVGPHQWEMVTSGFYGSSSDNRGSSRR